MKQIQFLTLIIGICVASSASANSAVLRCFGSIEGPGKDGPLVCDNWVVEVPLAEDGYPSKFSSTICDFKDYSAVIRSNDVDDQQTSVSFDFSFDLKKNSSPNDPNSTASIRIFDQGAGFQGASIRTTFHLESGEVFNSQINCALE